MYLRGRRGFGALVLLIVLMMSALTMLPMHAQGQTNQITGLVTDCASSSVISGALVTLTDANGYQPTQTAVTGGDGVYAFTPSAASYTIRVTRGGYFANSAASPIRFDGTSTVTQDFCLDATPTANRLLQLTVVSAATNAPIRGASVQAFYPPRGQVVANGTTSATGQLNLTLWSDTFELRTYASGFAPNITSVATSVVTILTIRMENGGVVQGHARNPSGQFLSAGLEAFLYNPAAPLSSGVKVIRADVTLSFFKVNAPAGSYVLIIDANGYRAYTEPGLAVTTGSTITREVTLQPSARETYSTTVAYGASDWNNLTVYRNLTLNPDTTLSTLNPAGLRDLRLQVDFTLGNGNGAIEGSEATAFHDWLVANGPFYVTTDGFLTTNGKAYLSATSYSVTVAGLTTAGSKVGVNTTATYALKQVPPYIASGAQTYFVNVTMGPDSNGSAYQDYVYTVALPRSYELNASTTVPANAPVTTKNFTRVTIDPGVTTASPQIRMTISQSINGTARAKVAAPTGMFYVQNATFTNYQAYVANNTTLTFSAEDSTDPNGHIADANFTWRFTPSLGDVRYGIRPTYKYAQNGTFAVNLTVRETGGNETYRNITVYVDDQLPLAKIRTNRTGTGSANGLTLRVDEGISVRFDGGLSTDLAYIGTPNKTGVILGTGYSWDFDGDRVADATGRIVNWTFRKPGQFTVNLTVTDSVGWKSVNATMTAIVNDTKAPVPVFDILDPSKDWGTITSPTERKTHSFNASKTTDDYDKIASLNFTWTIPGPIVGMTGTNHTFYGQNVTFAWQEWNNSYKVLLSVRDTGFPSGKSNTGNLTRNITVQIDTSIHADLKIESGTMKVTPGDPEEGMQVTVDVNVTNKKDRLAASNVTTELYVISGGQTTLLTNQAEWFDKNGNSKGNHTILAGETVKLVFRASLSGQGNKTVQVYVYDSTEPYTWRTGENKATNPANVRQPAWQPYAIWGSVIGVVALFVFGMYARRKIKAGEWRPIRGRREKREGEEKKPRKEVKEEKKRL